MLIQDGKLNEKNFKELFPQFDWRKVPRVLTQEVTDYFYIGKFEDEERIIKLSVRPTKYMKISESLKGMTIDGSVPKKGYKGKTYNFGTTIEVLIDDKVLNKIKEVAKEPEPQKIQTISWS